MFELEYIFVFQVLYTFYTSRDIIWKCISDLSVVQGGVIVDCFFTALKAATEFTLQWQEDRIIIRIYLSIL